jgi:RNA polymerase sigma-70 factor (ECF subfamily)
VSAPEPQAGPPDAALVKAWRGGDEQAATELVRRHTRAVAQFLAAKGAGEDLDDLVQETFFRAFRRIETFRGDASLRAWLLAIGSNALTDLRRRYRRRQVLPLEDRDLADPGSDPHSAARERELLERLEEGVRELPPMQRDVFLMRAQQGIDYEEIARALETSVGAARVHYHHAVKRLRQRLI